MTALALMVVLPILLAGCTFHELSVESHGGGLAPTLGVDELDIQFVSFCDFGRVGIYYDGFQATKGVLAVTDSDLHFMTRHKRHLFSKEASSMPLAMFQGVSLGDQQIQMKTRNSVLILQLDRAATQQRTQEKYETLFQTIVGLGVPVFESEKHYVKTGYLTTGRRSRGFGGSGIIYNNDRITNPSAWYGSPYGAR